MNPYSGANFFQFFFVLLKRAFGLCPLPFFPSDELQLLTLLSISVSSSLLGTFLTLRKMTMVANSLSHTTLLGIVISLIFVHSTHNLSTPILILASLSTAFLTILFTEGLRYFFKLHEDAAIGLVFISFFALGSLLITLFTRSTHIGIDIITGNVDALSSYDLLYTALTALLTLLVLAFAFNPWAAAAFDPQFASSTGLSLPRYHYLQMTLTSLSLIVSIRAVGILLVLAFLVGPTLIARPWIRRLPSLVLFSLLTSFTFSLLGIALSRHLLSTHALPVSTGGLIVTLLFLGYCLSHWLKHLSRENLSSR